MGYPMTYSRVVLRNGLEGDYSATRGDAGANKKTLIAGDLRRLELDQRDENHLCRYAEVAGISEEQASLVLNAFFTDFGSPLASDWLAKPCWPDGRA